MNDHQDLNAYRWQILASRTRNPQYPFCYAVVTTGIVCRPGCPSRLPNPENVRFFDNCQDALKAGYRPCKRCHPLDDNKEPSELVVRVCRQIERDPDQANLNTLASVLGYTPAHLQKTFRQQIGITPFDYARALRQQRIYRELGHSRSNTDALLQAGYQSSSQFYTEFKQFSSLPPGSHRQSGKGEILTFAVADTTLGALVVAASDKGLCWISLGDDPHAQVEELQRHFARAEFCPPDEAFNQWVSQVTGLVEAPGERLSIPLDIRGTVFQRQVWEALRKIPMGSTMDYQALADKIGKPGGARAVASACAANVLAVAIPCHRIVRRDGSLSGYRWGVERKADLLAREKGQGMGN
ncbi:bifunctional DNA-binding transcriptional regulator/O6-methylguanine-DNA methyltransferase Ada [Alcanivorax sp. DP30]|uniref:bifunctional DNA-binding transcriptional regulator/O6-methylguanine-DNA methyltransferase Ada n=1 Tax=Alcanivorax sp. DP30 TaxID=2606217 RepID=UPI00137120D3|nr:bifunctional DNA-binding transcriptional regulator/O6-methylguanine-DNA methyltransferase Ada [Alcanivorax sp. DP30]MZR61815.1 bifunctional DNA-binding transcriptional regulator/O6-methylguanine-DNA methyltransferase Ada [Alcanivorax sp. DP30]